ncbi:MAG: hypothetical protein ABI112_06000 [Terracoccus sp.]
MTDDQDVTFIFGRSPLPPAHQVIAVHARLMFDNRPDRLGAGPEERSDGANSFWVT